MTHFPLKAPQRRQLNEARHGISARRLLLVSASDANVRAALRKGGYLCVSNHLLIKTHVYLTQ